jgi:hypothetical protein
MTRRVQLTSKTISRFSRVIGEDAALALAAAFGGRTLYIPHRARPDSDLVQAIGADAAGRLGERFGGMTYAIPISEGKRARILHLRLSMQLTVARIAETVSCTERHVYAVLEEYGSHASGSGDAAEDVQHDMFG